MEIIKEASRFDGMPASEIVKRMNESRIDYTQRATCPGCKGKCLVHSRASGWQACGTCSGKGWVLEHVYIGRAPEYDPPGVDAFVERHEYVVDELMGDLTNEQDDE
jgi:ribosomal protein L37AE/L43A